MFLVVPDEEKGFSKVVWFFKQTLSRTIMSQVKAGHFNDFLGLNMLSVQQG